MTQKNSLFSRPQCFWAQHREASCNWLAFGLLLAAWNLADPADPADRTDPPNDGRPASLRAYPCVSVRAVQRDVSRLSARLQRNLLK